MRAAMETLLHTETAPRLKEKGLARVALFNWDDTARQTLEAYKHLV